MYISTLSNICTTPLMGIGGGDLSFLKRLPFVADVESYDIVVRALSKYVSSHDKKTIMISQSGVKFVCSSVRVGRGV